MITKERLKSILLGFLIILNFILGSRILIEKKLWPTGYNFFSNIGNWQFSELYDNIVRYFTNDEQHKTQILSPEKILINTGDQTTRISLNPNNNFFGEIRKETDELLKKALSMPMEMISEVNKEELYSALSTQSVYLSYTRKYNIGLFNDLLGNVNNLSEIVNGNFSDFIIPYSSGGSKGTMYIADFDSDKYYRIEMSDSTEKLYSLCAECINKHSSESENVINYSYDLKFDKPFGVQKTTLNPLIQIYSTIPQMPIVNSVNPITDEAGNVNEALIDSIFSVFNINASTMRRYTEAGGTLVFVENNAILKIDHEGFLEYTSMDSGTGTSSVNANYSNILNATAISAQINKALGNDDAMCLTQNEADDTVNFDYMVSGTRVIINNDRISCAASAKMKDGRLLSYKQLLRRYSETPEISSPNMFYTALDNAIVRYSEFMNEINIKKMFIGYSDDGAVGNKYADWVVEVDNVIVGE